MRQRDSFATLISRLRAVIRRFIKRLMIGLSRETQSANESCVCYVVNYEPCILRQCEKLYQKFN